MTINVDGKVEYTSPNMTFSGIGFKGWKDTGPFTINGRLCFMKKTFDIYPTEEPNKFIFQSLTFTKA